MSRKVTLIRNVPVNKLVPYFANPSGRTDKEKKDFQELAEHVAAGNYTAPPLTVYDQAHDEYLVANGHRRRAAHLLAGHEYIDVLAAEVVQGETPEKVREALFAQDNKMKKFAGKEHFQVALKTNGRVLMSKTVEEAWSLVEKHVPHPQDREWLLENGTPELMRIARSCTNYAVAFHVQNGAQKSQQWISVFYRKALRWLLKYQVQRSARDYVADHITSPSRVLVNAIENDKPMAILIR